MLLRMTDIVNPWGGDEPGARGREAVSRWRRLEARVTRARAALVPPPPCPSSPRICSSGRALARLLGPILARSTGDSEAAVGVRRDIEESAMLLPFDGGPVEQALRNQQIRLLPRASPTPAGCGKGSGRCSRR